MPKTIKLCRSSSSIHSSFHFFGGVLFTAVWLAVSALQAQTTNFVLGTTNLLVGPAAGTNSVVLGVTPTNGAWTTTANTNWLHLSPANQSGTGSTNVIFSYDANPGSTRSGTLTVGDQTLVITQAGSTYVPARPLITLVSSGLDHPYGVAVDVAGNVYIADSANSAIKEWTIADGSVTTLVSGLVSYGVAVDDADNVYFADTVNNAIKEWTATDRNTTTLVSSGLAAPFGVAVDKAGDVYIADTVNQAIKKWVSANSNVTTLVSLGFSFKTGDQPHSVAVDGAGNIYIPEANFGSGFPSNGSVVEKWRVSNNDLVSLVAYPEISEPFGIAVDGTGSVYIADTDNHAIKKWTAANDNVATLVEFPEIFVPMGMAVDGMGNVYVSEIANNAIYELPSAFVDPTPKSEGMAAGSDALPVVLPVAENLLPPFAPTSDQSWLTITGTTNGVVSFSYTADTGPARTAHITLLRQTIPITQGVIGTPSALTGTQMLGDGVLQFVFTNNPNGAFTVLSTTDLLLPLNKWTVVGAPTNTGPGMFQFTSQPTTNDAQRYYRVISP